MIDPIILASNPTQENVEKLKLYKNSKGYTWEIQLIGIDIPRIQEINEQMEKLYGAEFKP